MMPFDGVRLNQLQAYPDWTVEPDSSGPHGTATISLGPVATFSVKPAVRPGNVSDNFYFLRRLGALQIDTLRAPSYFSYSLNYFLTTADVAASQAIEFELQQNVAGMRYNMAWQADLAGSKLWRTFDFAGQRWQPTTIPVTVASFADRWLNVRADYARNPDNSLTHVGLTVDGIYYPINVTRKATTQSGAEYLNMAHQMDGNGKAQAYSLKLRDVNLCLW